ncbi:conjugative transposon protein TraK [Mucilaginibacter sabulilitoris]|uniref:Conjugative transposon protein TraK n=1 Tax=Mucilaginibacter sabulilitoris TaxID=1173583 RepID=A0ABZ0TPK6_9SPHI|nr:conjugative transposon protein TraK [Mucilaginibacter sabulilitoris]WPU94809.1 conjugative transposon protein TraK [Mucilaginibacter sabulilitoris]
MFSHLKNIDTAFKHIRQFSLFLIIGNVITMCFCIYKSTQAVNLAQSRIHILYNGKLLEASATDRKSNLPVELRDHIKSFHEYFFNLSPDDKAIQANVGKALYLADESAKRQYDNLRESGYFNNLISANISQEIKIDSTRLQGNQWPYLFTCYATEKLVRSSGTVYRKLVTQGEVRDIQIQTDNNPHGFLIQHWEILANRDSTIQN